MYNKRLCVYVAGKYSDTSIEAVLNNIRIGIATSRELLLAGYAPFCPWLDFQYIITMTNNEFDIWDKRIMYDYALAWLDKADCLFLLPARTEESVGVQMELARARERGIPIFTDIDELDYFRVKTERVHTTSEGE